MSNVTNKVEISLEIDRIPSEASISAFNVDRPFARRLILASSMLHFGVQLKPVTFGWRSTTTSLSPLGRRQGSTTSPAKFRGPSSPSKPRGPSSPAKLRGPSSPIARRAPNSPIGRRPFKTSTVNLSDMRGMLRNANEGQEFRLACRTGDIETVRAMMNTGIKINEKGGRGFTAVMCAAYQGQTAVVTLLIESGANINLQTDEGCMPLSGAARNGHLETIAVLLAAGANARLTTNDGSTPLDVAVMFEQPEVAALLEAHMATLETRDVIDHAEADADVHRCVSPSLYSA